MGILIFLATIPIILITYIFGFVCMTSHHKIRRDEARGSWLIYIVSAIGVAVLFHVLGRAIVSVNGGGSPTSADFLRLFLATVFITISPGIGLIAGKYISRQVKKTSPSPRMSEDSQSVKWDCPKCETLNPNDSYKCKRCGYSLI